MNSQMSMGVRMIMRSHQLITISPKTCARRNQAQNRKPSNLNESRMKRVILNLQVTKVTARKTTTKIRKQFRWSHGWDLNTTRRNTSRRRKKRRSTARIPTSSKILKTSSKKIKLKSLNWTIVWYQKERRSSMDTCSWAKMVKAWTSTKKYHSRKCTWNQPMTISYKVRYRE